MIQDADVKKLKCIYESIIKSLVHTEQYGIDCNKSNLEALSEEICLYLTLLDISPTLCRTLECKILDIIETSTYADCSKLCNTITVPVRPDILVEIESGVGSVVEFADLVVTTDCNKDIEIFMTAGMPSGSFFPLGETDISFTITDSCGNEAIQSFTIEVILNT